MLTLTLGVILFFAHPAHAQFIGDRMRITAEHGEEILGRMKGYDAYSLTILTDSTELSIAYADMVRLQRSLGVRSYYRDGAMMGLGVGVFFSISAAATRGDALAAVVGIGFLGGVGGLTGMMVGATIRREKWKPLDIPDQNAASIIPVIGVSSTGRLALGDRMRITTEHGENLIGRMKEYDNHSLTILTGFTEQSIAYADMVRLHRSLGIRGYSIEGIVIGLAAGALVSIVSVAGDEDSFEGWGGFAALIEIGISSAAGGLTGLIVGAMIRQERWERLDIPGQGAASVMPTIGVHPTGRLALGARISF